MLGVDRDSQFIGPGPDSGEQEAARQNETAPQINGKVNSKQNKT